MTWPSDDEIRSALEEHAIEVKPGRWAFHAHPMNVYGLDEALTLTKVNLMLGNKPNGSLSARMLEIIVERIAHLEQAAEMGA
jgi:hypothetical protein